MAQTRAHSLSNKSKGAAYMSGMGYKGVLRRGSSYGWKYEDGRICQQKGGYSTAEEAAYHYDEFITAYTNGTGDTNQALGLLKQKHVLEIRAKLTKADKPKTKLNRTVGKTGFKGVAYNQKGAKPYRSQIMIKGKNIHIGTYATAEEAARAYDLFVLTTLGPNAETNLALGLFEKNANEIISEEPVIIDEMPEVISEPSLAPDEDKQPEFNIPPRGYETRINYADSCREDDERQRQIEAARLMAEDSESEAEIIGDSQISYGIPAPLQPEKPTPPTVPDNAMSVHSLPPQTVAPAVALAPTMGDPVSDLVTQAAQLMQQAVNLENANFKRHCAEALDVLAANVVGYQKAMDSLIDFHSGIEKQVAELRKILGC